MKNLLKNLIFSIVIVGTVLLFLEIPLRIFWYSPPPMPRLPQAPPIVSDLITDEWYYDLGVNRQAKTELADEKKAQQEAPPQAESASYEQKTASQTTGMKVQQEAPSERQPSYRILLLGDSFAAGIGVKKTDRFSNVLNAMLGNKVEVINEGRGGMCTASELLFFLEECYKYKPIMVIYQFFWNDISENMGYCSSPGRKPKLIEKGILIPEKIDVDKVVDGIEGGNIGRFFIAHRRLEYLRAWLHHHSSLFNALRAFYIKTGLLEWKPVKEQIHERFIKPLDVNLTLDLLKQLKERVKEKGVDKFLVAVVPSNGGPLADAIWPTLKDFLDKEDIPYIYPSDEFTTNLGTYYIPVDGHFSVYGNRRFAELLYELVLMEEPKLGTSQGK